MTDTANILDAYHSLVAKSGEMLDAARNSDWDRLIGLGQDYHVLTAILERLDDAGTTPEAALLERKAALIRKALANDAAIREITLPRMNHLTATAATVRQASLLRQAYEYDTLELGAGGT